MQNRHNQKYLGNRLKLSYARDVCGVGSVDFLKTARWRQAWIAMCTGRPGFIRGFRGYSLGSGDRFSMGGKFFRQFFWVVLPRHFTASILELPAWLFFLFQCIPVAVRCGGCDFHAVIHLSAGYIPSELTTQTKFSSWCIKSGKRCTSYG